MKKRGVFAILLFFILLTGCGHEKSGAGEMTEMVNVHLDAPAKADLNEKVSISAHVTQGEEEVADADEVVFEIWKDGEKEQSEMIDFTSQDKGIYKTDISFDEDGIYYIQVHVTARSMHVMPKTQIVVGEVESIPMEESETEHQH